MLDDFNQLFLTGRFWLGGVILCGVAELRERTLKVLMQPEFPHHLFFLFLVAYADDCADELIQSAGLYHLIQQNHWACVSLKKQVEKADVTYLNNFTAS